MKFYIQTHKHYCGIDLHARNLYVCILEQSGETRVHKNIKAHPDALMKLIMPYLEDLVIGVECIFSWYRSLTFVAIKAFRLSSVMHSTCEPFIAVKLKTTRSIRIRPQSSCAVECSQKLTSIRVKSVAPAI